ncbi:glutamate--cysteine ligase [Terrabacter terrae]|uniref:Putative glutamate--cysteine ligase 2 n=1 Tax=Terrabacter terrae TaxID=318434 RepID=A0ABN2U6M6_9MICO
MPAAPLNAGPLAPTHAPAASGAVSTPAAPALPTIGVEEEFLLLDRTTGLPVPVAGPVLALAKSVHGPAQNALQHELLRSQVETATPACSTLGEVAASLRASRRALALAAEEHHVGLGAVGTAPDCHAEQPVTQDTRYLALRRTAGALVDEQLLNGMHVHVEVPDRETGVKVMNRLRPYLPVLLAFSANSPVWRGRDTGFASWRAVHMQRWPVEGAPPFFADAAEHEAHLSALLRTGVILDLGMVYWQARLSEHFPTIEVRVGDVAPDVDSAVAFAGLVRGLVTQALADEDAGHPCPQPSPSILRAASWQAASHGLDRELVVPTTLGDTPHLDPAVVVVLDVARQVAPLLGDEGEVMLSLVRSVLERGNGARRQREALAQGGLPAVTHLVCEIPEEA